MRTAAEFEQFYQTGLRPLLEDMEAIRKKTLAKVLWIAAIALLLACRSSPASWPPGTRGMRCTSSLPCASRPVSGLQPGGWKLQNGFQGEADRPHDFLLRSGAALRPVQRPDPGGIFVKRRLPPGGGPLQRTRFGPGSDREERRSALPKWKPSTKPSRKTAREIASPSGTPSSRACSSSGTSTSSFPARPMSCPTLRNGCSAPWARRCSPLGASHGQLVKLEDPEFEKAFVVYSSDQIEARYILSPALMRRILDFKNANGRAVHVGFANSRVYVALELRREMFDPSWCPLCSIPRSCTATGTT